MTTNQHKPRFYIDILIMFIIAGCLIYLIIFTNAKFNEIIASDREALLIEHDPNDPVHAQLAEEIIDFRPDACKMIEVYSEEYESIFRVEFNDDNDSPLPALKDHDDLINLFNSHEQGHTEITIDDKDEDVYFRWTLTTEGERCLFIIYMSRPVTKNLWVVTALCIFIMILVGIIMVRFYIHMHEVQMMEYSKLSDAVCDAVLR